MSRTGFRFFETEPFALNPLSAFNAVEIKIVGVSNSRKKTVHRYSLSVALAVATSVSSSPREISIIPLRALGRVINGQLTNVRRRQRDDHPRWSR